MEFELQSITSFDEKFLNTVFAAIAEYMEDESFSVYALSLDVGYSNMQLYRKLKALTAKLPLTTLQQLRDSHRDCGRFKTHSYFSVYPKQGKVEYRRFSGVRYKLVAELR